MRPARVARVARVSRGEGVGLELRFALERARLMLVVTPSVCPPGRSLVEVVEAALPWVDVLQVRVKHPDDRRWSSPAAQTLELAERLLDMLAAHRGLERLLIVNDRVDVARALVGRGIAGAHLGADDCPPALARAHLGAELLVGLSTHSMRDVVAAQDEPVDYLGFGPVYPTRTKPADVGLGPEAAWIAASSTSRPLFPIGGIDATNAGELVRTGRAAVSAAILAAPDPGRAARELRAVLIGDPDGPPPELRHRARGP
jgi:thiamine-phosphate pyrophosphorylase